MDHNLQLHVRNFFLFLSPSKKKEKAYYKIFIQILLYFTGTEVSIEENANSKNLTKNRQLEVVAFPVGIAIGTIGALLLPTLFSTTTTTTAAPDVGASNSGIHI